jgi:hypothetical protein
MKHKKDDHAQGKVLAEQLANLPKNILNNHESRNLASLVLHYLGHKDCFNFKKAAYFVDNPDFDHVLGVAGYANHECSYHMADDIWNDPASYSEQAFNKNVTVKTTTSFKRKNIDIHSSQDIAKLAREVGIENPRIVELTVKHGNHGILLYEANQELSHEQAELLKNAAHFLGFCSINH